jgi:exodeoxyribonuclease-3
MSLLIASWNVNSVKARMGHLLSWLDRFRPDIVLLQETKCTEDSFPYLDFETTPYNIAVVGEKSYNGVAVLSKAPMEVLCRQLNGQTQARYLEVLTANVKVASVYVPNGEDLTSPKFTHKMAFFDALHNRMQAMLADGLPVIVGGDFNVAHQPVDVYDPKAFANRLLFSDAERAKFRTLIHHGYQDALRLKYPEEVLYSWWDYRAGRYDRNEGVRIDYLLTSSQATDRLGDAGIDRSPRGLEKPSDHTPVWIRLESVHDLKT